LKFKNSYNGIRGALIQAADEMSDAIYSFNAIPMERRS